MSDDQRVQDYKGTEIVVGSKVLYGADDLLGTVIEVTDADADYNDELQRAELYPPKVTVQFSSGLTDTASTHDGRDYRSHPDDTYVFTCDDLTVITNPTEGGQQA